MHLILFFFWLEFVRWSKSILKGEICKIHVKNSFKNSYLSRVKNIKDLGDDRSAFRLLGLLTQDLDVSKLAEVEVALLLQPFEVQSHVHELT